MAKASTVGLILRFTSGEAKRAFDIALAKVQDGGGLQVVNRYASRDRLYLSKKWDDGQTTTGGDEENDY